MANQQDQKPSAPPAPKAAPDAPTQLDAPKIAVHGTDAPPAPEKIIDEEETPILKWQCVREMGGQALYPVKDEDEVAWLLPYTPMSGQDYALAPGGRAFLETGLKVQIPLGYVLRISHPISRGKPGMLFAAVELDHRYEHEIIVPVRNENGRDPIIVYPAQYFFSARLFRSEQFHSVPVKMPKFDVHGKPIK